MIVGADLDPVDEFAQELLHNLRAAVSDRVPKLLGDGVQLPGAWERRGRSLHSQGQPLSAVDQLSPAFGQFGQPGRADRPPYRRHNLATTLLRRVIADAPARGVTRIEAYPFSASSEEDTKNFRGTRSMFEAHGFQAVEARERATVMRLHIVVDQ